MIYQQKNEYVICCVSCEFFTKQKPQRVSEAFSVKDLA